MTYGLRGVAPAGASGDGVGSFIGLLAEAL
jgi:hypothetical protein